MSVLALILAATVANSLVALAGAVTLGWSAKTLDRILHILVGFSAGTLLAGAFFHLLAESLEEMPAMEAFYLVFAGFILFFVLERLLHWHHCHEGKCDVHPFSYLIIFGDAIHNFVDGLIIAGAYLIDTPVGIATTIAVIIHEIPQEIADFGVLLYSGFSKAKALFFNFLSAATAILGAIVGLLLSSRIESFSLTLLPIATGGFLYIAGSNLIPELHKECGWKESIIHFGAMLFGIALMVALLWLE